MADYIVTQTQVKPNNSASATVVVRFDTPTTNNSGGVAWPTALAGYRAQLELAGTTRWPGGTVAQLDDGSRHEFVFEFRTNLDKPGAIIAADLEAAVSSAVVEETTRLQNLLAYWGYVGATS